MPPSGMSPARARARRHPLSDPLSRVAARTPRPPDLRPARPTERQQTLRAAKTELHQAHCGVSPSRAVPARRLSLPARSSLRPRSQSHARARRQGEAERFVRPPALTPPPNRGSREAGSSCSTSKDRACDDETQRDAQPLSAAAPFHPTSTLTAHRRALEIVLVLAAQHAIGLMHFQPPTTRPSTRRCDCRPSDRIATPPASATIPTAPAAPMPARPVEPSLNDRHVRRRRGRSHAWRRSPAGVPQILSATSLRCWVNASAQRTPKPSSMPARAIGAAMPATIAMATAGRIRWVRCLVMSPPSILERGMRSIRSTVHGRLCALASGCIR